MRTAARLLGKYARKNQVSPPAGEDADELVCTWQGGAGEEDVAEYLNGRLFRFWTNEDTVKGDYVGHNPDVTRNAADNVVNGRYDLVNLFAVKFNLKPFIDAWGSSVTFELSSCGEDTMRYCAVNVNPNEADKIYKDDTFTRNGSVPLHTAQLNTLQYDGVQINPSEVLGDDNAPGVLAFEAAAADETVTLCVKVDDEVVYSFTMPISISSVKDMYSWIGVRHLSGGEDIAQTAYRKMWENETVKSLIFIHGYNVDGEGAKEWGDTVFKRFWLSGLKAEFYNVNWRGDIGTSLNYHQNASNAFVVASQLAPIIRSIPGEKVLMAHSLGNIVASSMIHDYDLPVSRYIMCNSAVPAEAYDTSVSLRVPQLVHPDWEEYPEISWSANWHSLFVDDEKDDRKHLGWKGRFSKVLPVAVNFYSTGDEVLELLSDNNVGILSGITDSFAHHAWHKQELFKGRGIGVGAGATDWSGWNIEENLLGINKISIEESWRMTDADFKTNTVFYCYPTSMNTTNISLLVRGAHLALGIPALTPAAGVTNLGGDLMDGRMVDMNDDSSSGVVRPNGWPSKSSYPYRWLHSDIKDVSYFFNFKFYEKLIEKGGLR